MLTLAVYEAFTPDNKRGAISEFIRRWEIRMIGELAEDKNDPLGNALVESTRLLSGLKKMKKKVKPKKPPSLSKVKGNQGRAKKVRGKKTKKNVPRRLQNTVDQGEQVMVAGKVDVA